MLVRLCYNRRVGLGVEAVTRIPQGTRVLFYYGNLWSTIDAHNHGQDRESHFMTIQGTGCTIDGGYDLLFPNEPNPNLTKSHQVPCGLMSLTNSSHNYKPPNCMVHHDDHDPRMYLNGHNLNTTAWLITTRDIEIGEELIWNYLVR